jgi:hypothetical protein
MLLSLNYHTSMSIVKASIRDSRLQSGNKCVKTICREVETVCDSLKKPEGKPSQVKYEDGSLQFNPFMQIRKEAEVSIAQNDRPHITKIKT